MRVRCSFSEITLMNENDQDIDSVEAVCSLCQHTTQSFGTSARSRRRCLAMMAEECPNGDNFGDNFYVDEDC